MNKAKHVHEGDTIAWAWGRGEGKGRVTAVHDHDVTKTIKGATVKRKASTEKPAVEVKTDKGGRVLKSASEIAVK